MSWTSDPQGFIDVDTHPRAKKLSERLQYHWMDLAEEGERHHHLFQEWHEPINGGGWQVWGIKWQGQLTSCCFAQTLVEDDFVVNAAYSVMMPGTEIYPHVGYTGRVLRMHIGLICPPGECALIVGGERRQWQNGEVLFFDDTVEHSAYNRTQHPRLVFLLDVLRK